MFLTPLTPPKRSAGMSAAGVAGVRSATRLGLFVAAALMGLPAIAADSTHSSHQVTQTAERVQMIVKSSRVLSLSDRIPRFQVHNEEILTATPISENQIQIFAKVPGSTELNLWDTQDQQYTVTVTIIGDAREVEGVLNSQLPLASLKVTPIRESAILSGYVTTADDVERAVAITEQFYGVVINNISVIGLQQVLLHTRIMEVSRTKARNLGIDLAFFGDVFDRSTSLLTGTKGLVSGTDTGPSLGLGDSNVSLNSIGRFNALIEALEKNDLVKLLAEPTLVSTHGRAANFTLGGRTPYVVSGANGAQSVNYLPFGTIVDFVPFVVGPGRVRLEVRAEVSERNESVGIALRDGTQIPGFLSRNVDTAVEMNAGETFAVAGLLYNRTEASIKRVPFLGSLPYGGSLFRNVSESTNQLELLIMVTPELVDAMAPHEVPPGGPGLNTQSPGQHEFYADGHIEVPNLKGDQCAYPSGGPGIPDRDIRYGTPMTPNHHYQNEVIVDPTIPSAVMEQPGEMMLLSPQANATPAPAATPAQRRGWGTGIRQAAARITPRPTGPESATLIEPRR